MIKLSITVLLVLGHTSMVYCQNPKQYLETGWYEIKSNPIQTIKMYLETDSGKSYNVWPKPLLTKNNFEKAEIVSDKNPRLDGLRIALDEEGADKWNLVTKYGLNLYFLFIIDNKIEYVWYCDHQVTDGKIYISKAQMEENQMRKIVGYLNTKK